VRNGPIHGPVSVWLGSDAGGCWLTLMAVRIDDRLACAVATEPVRSGENSENRISTSRGRSLHLPAWE